MPTMQIRPFPGAKIQITEVGALIKGRLIGDVVLWPQALPLLGYMAWPNDAAARDRWLEAHRRNEHPVIDEFVRKLKLIQQHWARTADIVHLHYDMTSGGHQERRGGPSVGKAIFLVDAIAKSKGTAAAKLWEIWKTYKDVAHLVAAAVLVSAEAQTRHRAAPYGLRLQQLQPFRMAMLVPELVIAVAMSFEDHGLHAIAQGSTESMFDPEALWCIPPDINVAPLPPPPRKIRPMDLVVLNERRAGNRGRSERSKTRPDLSDIVIATTGVTPGDATAQDAFQTSHRPRMA
jgi:hypothetical protein